jgi:hypothetical protein
MLTRIQQSQLSDRYGAFQQRQQRSAVSITNTLKDLQQTPTMKNAQMASLPFIIPDNVVGQCDLLFLPHEQQGERTFKYALVYVDLGSRKCDALPLTHKQSAWVGNAIDVLWQNSNYIQKPKYITFDDGSEFKGQFETTLNRLGVKWRRAVKKGHRQVSLAERYNQTIGKMLFHRQQTEEIRTHRPHTEWVRYLPDVIALINDHVVKTWPLRKRKKQLKYRKHVRNPRTGQMVLTAPYARCDSKKGDCALLEVGDWVHYATDEPKEAYNQNRPVEPSDRFRATDLRWTQFVYKIKDIAIQPYQPPMYKLEDVPKRWFMRPMLKLR